jgi:hypothetical protein
MALLRTILILFIIFYVVRMFTRYILPALFYNYMDDKMEELSRQQQKKRQREQQEARKHEGKVTIEYPRGAFSKGKHDKGEYTDYVEVKD